MLNARRTHRIGRAQRGITLVELLVGVAVGLFVVAGGITLLVNFTSENRRLLLETRLVQDLRAASDLVTRDLRRAGYWRNSSTSVWYVGGPTYPPSNDYRSFYASACNASPLAAAAPSPAASASSLCYTIDQDGNNVVDATDRYGFYLNGGVLYATLGGVAQPLTDPNSITVSDFVITPSSQSIPASAYCARTCTTNCPQVVVREFEVLLKGNIPGDASINRTLRSNVRVRNDHYSGQCPA